MRAVRVGLALAIGATSACAWLAGIEEPHPRSDGGEGDSSADSADSAGEASVPGADGGDAGACTGDQLLCDGTCIDPTSDDVHCGSCTTACSGKSCVAGHCVTPYYLSPTGDDHAKGTSPETAWKTFGHALGILEHGNALVLVDGIYTLPTTGLPIVSCKSGAANGVEGDPIVIAAQHERLAKLASDGSQPALRFTSCGFWSVFGLTATTTDYFFDAGIPFPPPDTVSVEGSTGIELRRLLVDRNNRQASTSGIKLDNAASSVVLDSEIYDCQTGLIVLNGATVDVRRLYVNPRASDADGGPASVAVNLNPNAGTAIAENVIAEGAQTGFLTGGNTPASLSVFGSIALGGTTGMFTNSFVPSVVVQDFVAVNTVGSGLVFSRSGPPSSAANITAVGTGGITLGSSVTAAMINADSVFGNGSGPGINQTIASWSVAYSNSASNHGKDYAAVPDASCTSCSSTVPTGVGLGTDECAVYVLPTSNMSHGGVDGGAVGANVIYRSENGALTTTKLWERDGSFPCGAVVEGINDDPATSCKGVGARLNFVPGGCPVP